MVKSMQKLTKFIQCKCNPFLFRNIANIFRILCLRCRGYQIGKNVYIGHGVKIMGEKVTIGNDVYILDNTVMSGRIVDIRDNVCIFEDVYIHVINKLVIGKRSKISRNCTWRANNIITGRDLWCNENVEIGGGGWNNENANLSIGSFMHIGRDVQINVCKPVMLEGYSGVGIGCMLFTHSAGQGQSVLNGYSFVEAPITVGKHVSLYTRVIVSPGTVIGEGATVATQSFVRGKLQPYTFYAGSPAKEKKIIAIPKKEEQWKIIINLFPVIVKSDGYAVGKYEGIQIYCVYCVELLPCMIKNGIVVTMQSCDLNLAGICVIDLQKMVIRGESSDASEKCRDYLRRHGIILKPANGYHFHKLNPFILRESSIER